MTKLIPIAIAATLVSIAATPAFGQSVEIENFIGQIEIVEGSKISIDGDRRGTVGLTDNRLMVDGGEAVKNISCSSYSKNGTRRVEIKRGGWNSKNKTALSDYPTLRITAPNTTSLMIRDSLIFGTVSDVSDVDVSLSSCGNMKFSDVSDTFAVSVSGSTDVEARNVGEARLATSGSGDFEIVNATSLSFRSSGSGDLAARAIAGPASIKSSGSGDAVIASVGDLLEFSSSGSGDLLVGMVDGPVELRSSGSGDVEIDRGDVPTLSATTTGSGDFTINANVGDVDLRSTGSGDMDIPSQSGRVTQRITGSGDLVVGDTRYNRRSKRN